MIYIPGSVKGIGNSYIVFPSSDDFIILNHMLILMLIIRISILKFMIRM
mgnify:CR=1 FL=1